MSNVVIYASFLTLFPLPFLFFHAIFVLVSFQYLLTVAAYFQQELITLSRILNSICIDPIFIKLEHK